MHHRYASFPAGTQLWHNVASTSMQRCIDVDATLYNYRVSAMLTLSVMGKQHRRQKLERFFLILTENRIWHLMTIIEHSLPMTQRGRGMKSCQTVHTSHRPALSSTARCSRSYINWQSGTYVISSSEKDYRFLRKRPVKTFLLLFSMFRWKSE